jgi:septal ring factor EnvC (AmiA/AmiB activator)
MLLFANERKSEFQKELESQLEQERSKTADVQTRFFSVSSELNALQERHHNLLNDHHHSQDMIAQLQQQLQQEKDRCLVLTAKYNTAMKEKDGHSKSPPRPSFKESSIMTSVDYSSGKHRRAQALLAGLSSDLLRQGMDEDDLFRYAEHKIADNNTPDIIHDLAKRQLAKEIMKNISANLELATS